MQLVALRIHPFCALIGRRLTTWLRHHPGWLPLLFSLSVGLAAFVTWPERAGAQLPPDLTISKTHGADFPIGFVGTYTITVTNAANAGPTSGPITVTDNLPGNLALSAGLGAGWSCTGTTSVICTNAGPLQPGASTTLQLNVTVGFGTPAGINSITNTAAVSTPSETNTSDNTASDPTTVLKQNSQTVISSITPNPAINCAPATVNFAVSNPGLGGPPTSGTVTVSNGTTSCTGVLNGSSGSCTLILATLGTHTLMATYSGNADFSGSSSPSVTHQVVANTPPTLSYSNPPQVALGGSLTVNPATGPSDDAGLQNISLQTVTPAFSGTLSVNSATGVVTISNAGPSGSFTVIVRATDNCGTTRDASFTFSVQPDSAPVIAVAAPVTRQQGSASASVPLATVSDAQTAAGNLRVTAVAPSGIALTNLSNNNGQISANLAVDCSAIPGANALVLTVTDSDGQSAIGNFIVNVTPNTPPDLPGYPATTVELGKSKTVLPGTPPTDNGTIVSLTATASAGFTGSFVTNLTTGAVTINNAGPLGEYTVTLVAADNCGALNTRSFALTVDVVNTVPTITAGGALARQQGSPGSVATIATVSDGQTLSSDLIVTATGVPTGLTLSNISNSRGTITANVAAACNAAVGANTVVLTVTDGGGLTATANLTVNVTSNTVPSLGSYNALSAKVGANAIAAPSATAMDNGALTSLTAAISAGFSGTLSLNQRTGVITFNNAGPAGAYSVTVRATDNCGASTATTFQLTVAGELICTNPRAGLVSWYRAEGNANDFKAANNGTLQNGVAFALGQVGQAFSFNGTNEVVIPNAASLNPQQFTFEGWLNPTQVDGGIDLILNKEDEPFTTFHYEIGIRGNGGGGGTIPVGNLAFALNGVTGLPNDFNGWVDGGGAVPLNTWTHFAVTFNGTTVKTYLNGVVARTLDGLSGSLLTSTGPLKLASRSNSLITQAPQDRFNGLLDELSLYDRALSEQEIQTIFNANRAGKCTVPINTAPTISAAPPLNAQQGSVAATVTLATVSDADTAAGELSVTVANAPSGLAFSDLVNTNGTITASLSAACNAVVGANTVTLQVSDGGLTSTTTLTVQVSANAPPVLGNYASPGTLALGGDATVTPTGPPADNGVITNLMATASGVFTGSLSINPATGAVRISNARPGGDYTVTIVATDNCGARTTTDFSFTVAKLNSTVVLTASAPPYIQGQPIGLTAQVAALQATAAIPSGTVTFFDDTTMLGTAALDVAGRATLTTTMLQPGVRGVTTVYNGDGNFNGATSAPLGLTVARGVANVSAASFRGDVLAPDQIVAAFGTRLATTTAQAQTLPLPTVLGGTVVRLRDSTGRERTAALFYVSPAQINYLMPGDLANGPATVTVVASDGTNSLAVIQIARTNPGVFTADTSGRGLPAAQVLRVLPNGTQRIEPVAVFDQAQNRFVAVPIDLGAANEQIFLILFGTGWRLRDAATPANATVGGVNVEIGFIGAQPSLSGLDQANLRLARALIGRGEVDVILTVDGKAANTVRINVK